MVVDWLISTKINQMKLQINMLDPEMIYICVTFHQ